MTSKQFILMLGEAETGGLPKAINRLEAIGDSGLAGGMYQMHWVWRKDYWPSWGWFLLRFLDELAISYFLTQHPHATARELADIYNVGHPAPDPSYEQRCIDGLARLGLPPTLLSEQIED